MTGHKKYIQFSGNMVHSPLNTVDRQPGGTAKKILFNSEEGFYWSTEVFILLDTQVDTTYYQL